MPIDQRIVNRPPTFARHKIVFFCVMVTASVSRGHGHTANATAGAKQRSATTTTAAAGARGHKFLRRQPRAISRAIANQLQSTYGEVGVATLEPSQQLKQNTSLDLSPSLLTFTNLTSHAIPITPADRSPPTLIYIYNKRFKLWGSIRRSLFLPILFRDNVSQLRK